MTIQTPKTLLSGKKRTSCTSSPSKKPKLNNDNIFATRKRILFKNNDPMFKERINSLIGESTSDPINNIIESPNQVRSQKQPSRLMTLIKRLLQKPSQQMSPLSLKFERSTAAALHNSELILQHNGTLQNLFDSMDPSVIHYGSEFRPIEDLKELLSTNTKWEKFSKILTTGVEYPMDELPENERLDDIEFHLQRGNHQSTDTDIGVEKLEKAYSKEVSYGWQVPILPSVIKTIKGACITPLGVSAQWTIDAFCNRIQKHRVIHDCSFPGPSGKSTNNRIHEDMLEDCLFGHALKRYLHGIHQMRFRYKKKRILQSKTDMDSAYRRLHAALKAAATCITIIKDLAYLLLRLPFGSSPAPSEFSVVSDVLVDITTEIADDDTWDPSALHSDHFDMMNSLPINLKNDSDEFGQADELIMDMEDKDVIFDIYIDDLLAAGVDSPKNREILLHAVTLALSILFRPLNKNDPLPRDDIVCERKQKAEALLEEVKTVLGWKIDTRAFRIYLPLDKLKHWNLDLEQAIKKKQIHIKTYESIIGRLNHAGFVLPFGKYFLSRLRYRLKCARNRKYKMVYLNKLEIEDLTLWKKLLFHAATIGIDINHITFTKFTITIYSDACEYGIGGYIVNGPAWRYEIPPHLQGLFTINLLEFIASKLTIQFAIHWRKSKNIPHQILVFTDQQCFGMAFPFDV